MFDRSQYKALKLDLDDRVLTITIDNAEQRNAMTPEISVEMHAIWRDVTNAKDVDAIILTAAGDRAFSAGGNVRNMAVNFEKDPKNWQGSTLPPRRLLQDMLDVEQPIICALNGDAYGLGASIAMMCDIIVANEKARLVDSHVRVGLVAADGGTLTWPLSMSIHKAKEHLMRGLPLLASDAAQLGIINYAVPYEEMMPKAQEIARELADGATWAIRWTKASVNKILRERLNLMVDAAVAAEWISFMSDDHREAINAMAERRTPKFTGR
jgi:enoyl-CoA hydratase